MAASEPKIDIEKAPSAGDSQPEVLIGEVKDIHNADAALDFLRNGGDVGPMTAEDERRLKRKIDWRVVPLLFACYILQYLDKTLINYANVMGLQGDTSITGDQYSQLAMIFYVSYLAFEFPHAWGMQRFPTAKYIGIMVCLWGVVLATTSACHDWAGLVVTRVLLGVFESAVAPSLIVITTMWYKRQEQPPRMGIWYLGTGGGTIVGSLISFGFQHYHSSGFMSWQIMFLICGLITIAIGATVIMVLPDNPMTARFLSREEKIWAIERLRGNQTGVENKHFKWPQFIECFTDPQTYLLALITISSNVPNGAVSSFQATIIKGFGYTSKETALLSIPSGAVSIVSILAATNMAGRFNQRAINIICLLVPGVVGAALMAFLPEDNKAGKLIGNYMTNCIGATLPLLYSLVGANYAGHTKKVTMNATLLICFCVGNIIGPLTFTAESAPDYLPAKTAIIVTCGLAMMFTLMLRFYYVWENKRRERLVQAGGLGHVTDIEFSDLTDRKNKEFRYTL
ncbi:Major facilitator superfamily transporter [Colletotrichum higginsianum IMI 349063]|uniref:Major facilitator superfamily transporter n=3 Tax=Colletotrichum higginsianum TaxID=80884 RepID=A0A1B7YCM7_COLHI|nr:Major facilitator superfamily transporter [Colletotrichum higginsianum IMI 349063]OBR09600.1 Major facilitator superfamily transporter [Colletotrichum higginsianum IMI 349063]TIC95992.1 putative transporter [Colletotrichum higginsianum]GJC96337.1 major facilitator superfamily transporter [Colletotrichum higginsianum]